ncbi:MAG: zinc-dependent metalloprotease [Bacteriovoracaceae bacterium]
MKYLIYLVLITVFTNIAFASDMKKSFSSRPLNHFEKSLNVKDYAISINKSDLGKLFILNSSIIDGPPASMGNSNKSKIVYFEKKEQSLYLFESVEGLVSTSSVKSYKLLTEFPLLAEEGDELVFNFKSGMNKLFIGDEMYASDIAEGGGESSAEKIINIKNSFLNKVEIRDSYLFIDQIILAEVEGAPLNAEVKYYIVPYEMDKNFPKKLSLKNKKIGFFEVSPTLEANNGRSNIFITKYDITKPVVYYISSNVPAQFKEAVTDGILYWNQAFGREVISVKDLPESISIHDPNYNIVQWVDFDNAGFAYANIQADPLTGKINQTHVYMTSAFTVGGAQSLFNLLQWQDDLTSGTNNQTKKIKMKLKGFENDHSCEYKPAKSMASLAKYFAVYDEATTLRFVQDYVRQVIAHEVGHTLGLRHNFSGTVGATLTPQNEKNIVKEYLKTGNVPEGIYPTSSVMEYNVSVDDALIGAYIRLKKGALPYDQKAIEWGYSEKSISEIKNLPPFCTDMARDSFHDCAIFDRFENSIEAAYVAWKDELEQFPSLLAIRFLKNKSPRDLRDAKPVEQITLDPQNWAVTHVIENYEKLINGLQPDTKFFKVSNQFPYESSFNEEEIKEEVLKYQKETLERLGGWKKLLTSDITPVKNGTEYVIPATEKLYEKYEKIVLDEKFIKGKNAYGMPYEFTPAEIEFMLKAGKKFFKEFNKQFFNAVLNSITGKNSITILKPELTTKSLYKKKSYAEVLGEDLESTLSDFGRTVLFAESKDNFVFSVGETEVKLPKYYFSDDLRVMATELVQPELFAFWSDFNENNKAEIKAKLKEKIAPYEKVETLPRNVLRFIYFETDLMKLL